MTKSIFLLLLFGSTYLAMSGQSAKTAAQPVKAPVIAPMQRVPFIGSIGYRISYVNYAPGLATYLPDSMTIWSQPPILRVVYHGGLSDTLQTEMQWDASQHVYYLIDRISNVAWTLDDRFQVPAKLPLKTIAKDTVLGLPCKVFEVPVTGGKDRYSITDSIHIPFVMADSLRDSLSSWVPPFLLPGQQCLPLHTVRVTPQGIVDARAVTIHPHLPEPSYFRMPSGYDVKPFDPRPRFHPLVPKPVDPAR